jgi:hypothetical protein
VSISRGQYHADIYTNDKSELARDLSRDMTQHTAMPSQEQERAALRIEPVVQQESPTQEQTPSHGLAIGL